MQFQAVHDLWYLKLIFLCFAAVILILGNINKKITSLQI